MNNFHSIWIKHGKVNKIMKAQVIYFREDRNSICVDFNNGKSQVDIILSREHAKVLGERLIMYSEEGE